MMRWRTGIELDKSGIHGIVKRDVYLSVNDQ